MLAQLREIWCGMGPMHELWFDGGIGGAADGASADARRLRHRRSVARRRAAAPYPAHSAQPRASTDLPGLSANVTALLHECQPDAAAFSGYFRELLTST
eukprot:gene148-1033_t